MGNGPAALKVNLDQGDGLLLDHDVFKAVVATVFCLYDSLASISRVDMELDALLIVQETDATDGNRMLESQLENTTFPVVVGIARVFILPA